MNALWLGLLKVATNAVVAFVTAFSGALAAGVGTKAALAAGSAAVVAVLAGLFQEKPNGKAA